MKISKNNQIFLLILIFLGLGLTVLLTDNKAPLQDNVAPVLGTSQNYPRQVRQWLREVSAAEDLVTVREVKDKILNFRAKDNNLGRAQVNLYLAFDYLEQFLVTKDSRYREKAAVNLSLLGALFPELTADLEQFKALIN